MLPRRDLQLLPRQMKVNAFLVVNPVQLPTPTSTSSQPTTPNNPPPSHCNHIPVSKNYTVLTTSLRHISAHPPPSRNIAPNFGSHRVYFVARASQSHHSSIYLQRTTTHFGPIASRDLRLLSENRIVKTHIRIFPVCARSTSGRHRTATHRSSLRYPKSDSSTHTTA